MFFANAAPLLLRVTARLGLAIHVDLWVKPAGDGKEDAIPNEQATL
jgi:hypothetical protein